MKKKVQRRLCGIIVIGMLFSLFLNYYLQIKMSRRDMENSSNALFWQINQMLEENTVETEEVKLEFQRECLTKAKMAAYIVEHRPSILEDEEEIKKIVNLLQIDEFHVFDTEGTIYAGSEPKYFGYNFNSGEQMQFFLPMLMNKELELCQPITPNTAEGKLMQYAAVWRDDEQGIIQIGMEPERVLKVTEKNELSYIFSQLTEDDGAGLYAADQLTHEILGSTNEDFVGKTLTEIGLSEPSIVNNEGFHAKIDGELYYCIFTSMDGILVGRTCSAHSLYGKVNENTLFLAGYLLAISIVMILSISRYLDKNIIRGIDAVNNKLQNITNGNLDETVDVHTTPEFKELSGYINRMVKSLLDTTDKLSSVLDMAQMPIGTYEYSHGVGRVRVTSKVRDILGLTEREKERLFSNYVLFEERLEEIRKYPVSSEEEIYQLAGSVPKYIKLESFVRDNTVFGILIDVTKSWDEKKRIEHERDEDLVTGLYSRRAFYTRVEEIFYRADELKHAAIIMIDTDNLKYINDYYGHEMGDCYLREMADILRSCTAPNKVTSRLSGDEFALLIYGCESREELQTYIDEMAGKQDGAENTFGEKAIVSVKFSMGTSYYPEDGENCHTLLKCADERMYEEKRRRKQRKQ